MPLLAGMMEQSDGARAGYLAVILPSCLVGAWLVAQSGDGAGGEGDRGSHSWGRRLRALVRIG
jgi:hypothetical protein